jgi:hypothetical protein
MADIMPPQFSGRPVILIHLVLDSNPTMAYCADSQYIPPGDDYPDIPRVACSLCMYFARQ